MPKVVAITPSGPPYGFNIPHKIDSIKGIYKNIIFPLSHFNEISIMLITPIPYLRKLIKEKKLKGCFIGRQYIVKEQELKNFISKLGVKNEN